MDVCPLPDRCVWSPGRTPESASRPRVGLLAWAPASFSHAATQPRVKSPGIPLHGPLAITTCNCLSWTWRARTRRGEVFRDPLGAERSGEQRRCRTPVAAAEPRWNRAYLRDQRARLLPAHA